jgi:hypothetical protein
VPTLAVCNLAGYVTVASQPGIDPGPGYDGLIWAQRAAVEGFVTDYDLLRRLVDAAADAGLELVISDDLDAGQDGITVTTWDGKPYTSFGVYLDYPNLRVMWDGIGGGAFYDVCRALRVTLAAREYGADAGQRLWDVLDAVTGRIHTAS